MRINHQLTGMALGFLAICGFSVTLPATRLAVEHLDPVLVGPGRTLFAAIPAIALLLWLRPPLPAGRQWFSLFIVMLGVVIGFPWLTSLAMQSVNGAQGGIIVSVLPLFTAIAGAIIIGQRPSTGFWIMSVFGSSLVFVYLLIEGAGQGHPGFQSGELILLAASVFCAIGYAEGGRLSKELGGVAVISWALVISIPFSMIFTTSTWPEDSIIAPWQSWAGFIYISLISQWLAFIFWYKGLALGGVVRVSQIQLLQPFLTFLVAALVLDETIDLLMIVFAAAVVMSIMISRKMPVNASQE